MHIYANVNVKWKGIEYIRMMIQGPYPSDALLYIYD